MRTFKRFFVAGVAVLVMAAVAVVNESLAQPSAALSTIPNVIVSPRGVLGYSMTIRNVAGVPMGFVPVTLSWPAAALGMTCVCPGSPIPAVAGFTDAFGVARFNIAAGGCINPATAGTGVDVFVGATWLATVGQVSPDLANIAGLPIPNCAVGITDAVSITFPLSTSTYTFCTDLNSDMNTGVADAVLMTPALSLAVVCP